MDAGMGRESVAGCRGTFTLTPGPSPPRGGEGRIELSVGAGDLRLHARADGFKSRCEHASLLDHQLIDVRNLCSLRNDSRRGLALPHQRG